MKMKTKETRLCASTRAEERSTSKVVFLLLAIPVFVFLSVWRAYRLLSEFAFWFRMRRTSERGSEKAARTQYEVKRPLMNAERGRYFETDCLDGVTPNMPRRNRVLQRKSKCRKSLSL
jgi:hypothetical protein